MTAAPAPVHAPFSTREQQETATTLCMWAFLGTELLLFGGLLTAYTVYRVAYPAAWAAGSAELYGWIGAGNTVVLLTSSFCAALAVRAAAAADRRTLVVAIAATIALGLLFLGIKGVEYWLDVTRGDLWPGPVGGQAFAGRHPELEAPAEVALFLTFYWICTGLHAVHMTIGLCVWAGLLLAAWRRRLPSSSTDVVEVVGMYWHFIDLVWLFLLPLLYLVN